MILLSSLVADAATAASGTPQWVLVRVQNPSGGFSSYSFGSTDCITSSSCFSANTGITSTHAEHVFVEHWNGKAWSTMKLPSFGQAAAEGTTCLSAEDCWFVGARFAGGYPTHAIILHWNGKVWKLSPSPPVKTASALNGIACYASGCVSVGVECVKGTSCFSVGGATETSDVRPLVETWDGRSWSISTSVQPKGSASANLDEVRCTSATHCVTIGTEESGSHKPSIAYGEVWNGKAWKVQPVPVPPETDHYPNSTVLNDLACTSASDCVAVGGATPQSSGLSLPSPLIETWNGSAWKIAKLKLVLSGPLTLQDVACLSPTRCAVVGFRNGYIVPSLTAAGIWNGKALVLVKSANEPKYTDSQLFTLGCAGVSRCVALGQAQKGTTYKVIAEKSSLPK